MPSDLTHFWYAAASSAELTHQLLPRMVLGEQLVLFRTETGEAAALIDRCAHRFARLSGGELRGDHVVCPYHGMEYRPDGRCVRIPGQERVPEQARVRSFPVLERYGLIFVWMGEPALADPKLIIDIAQYGSPDWGLSRGYAKFGCHWRLIMDNLIDPAHTSFVHRRTIGNDAGAEVPLTAETLSADTVVCGRWINDAPAVPVMQRFARPPGNVDRWQFYYVKLPSTSIVDFGCVFTGRPHTPEEQDRAPYRVLSYAFLTPADAVSTHYFSLQLRNFAADDSSVTDEFNRLYHATFEEDRLLLEDLQRSESTADRPQPLFIASDAGVVRMRRLLDAMLATP